MNGTKTFEILLISIRIVSVSGVDGGFGFVVLLACISTRVGLGLALFLPVPVFGAGRVFDTISDCVWTSLVRRSSLGFSVP